VLQVVELLLLPMTRATQQAADPPWRWQEASTKQEGKDAA